jgi:hypothetical protein
MTMAPDLFARLEWLVDGWCDRRALRPLSIILRAYPMVSPLSDSWHDLRSALRDLRCLEEPQISRSEAADVEEVLRVVDAALGARGWKLPRL